jgi:hypothetical protein
VASRRVCDSRQSGLEFDGLIAPQIGRHRRAALAHYPRKPTPGEVSTGLGASKSIAGLQSRLRGLSLELALLIRP